MAQSLEQRINSALRSAARLKDVEAVIADVEAEIGSAQVRFDAENARSIDPALTTPEAREARNNAADLEHDIRRLNASLGLLAETRDKIVKRTAEEQRLIRYDAAKAERDDLARHIRARYPELAQELAAMARRIEASNAECDLVNKAAQPADKLEAAEHIARETGHYWPAHKGGGPIVYLSQMYVPLLGREGGYLPLHRSGLMNTLDQWEAQVAADVEFAKRPIPGLDPAPADEAEPAKADA